MTSPENDVTLIHRIADATHEIITPANVISAVGLGLSAYGATHIQDVSGVLQYGAGRVLDVIDGPIARRTYPGSRIGAVVDASFDKLAVAFALLEAWNHHAAPEGVIAVMALMNVINAASTVYADRKGTEPVTSKAGKYFMFGYNASFGAYVLGNALGGNTGLELTGAALFAATTPIAAKASYDYTKAAWQARTMAPKNRVTSSPQIRKVPARRKR